jgi:hypothetical protein
MGESQAPATPGGDDRQIDFHPGMEMRWEITRSTEDTAGELFESKNWLDPQMPGPPVHVHPTQEESFAVIEGVLDCSSTGSGARWVRARRRPCPCHTRFAMGVTGQ